MERISKRELSRVAALKKKKHRRERGKLIVEGWRLVGDALAAGALESIMLLPESPRPDAAAEILGAAQKKNVPIYSLRPEEVQRITTTVTPPGVFGVAGFDLTEAEKLLDSAGGRPAVYLYEVGDPGNAGTILRTAHALGAGGVILSPGSCDPSNAKAARSSMGALFKIPVAACEAEKVFEIAKQRGYTVAAAAPPISEEEEGAPPESLCESQPVLIILGSEPHGLPEEIISQAGRRITIPISPGAESLNVAAACAIVLYALGR